MGPVAERTVTMARAVLGRLGLTGLILLGTLACDLLLVVPAAFDDVGRPYRDLLILPGVLGMAGCALLARSRPALAAFAGALVLAGTTVLIRLGHAPSYSTLLTNISLTETVAGFQLVMYATRRLHPGVALAGISSLVVACLFSVFQRDQDELASSTNFLQSMSFGILLLAIALLVGLRGRHAVSSPTGLLGELLTQQWPLLSLLAVPLFFDVVVGLNRGPGTVPVLALELVAVLTTVLGTRYPLRAALVLAGTILVTAAAVGLLDLGRYLQVFAGMPFTQVVSGMAAVVLLVRDLQRRPVFLGIGALSLAVAIATLTNGIGSGPHRFQALQLLVPMALLMLGLAIALGMYFRTRDRARAQVVRTAVNDAQTAERMALARELHDVVAHHVTGIVVQAQAAKLVSGRKPEVAVEALDRIENAGTEALVAMRRLVGSMRGDAPAGSSEASSQATTDLDADLRRVIAQAHHQVPVEVALDLPPAVPQEVARSALRLVQESLTNVGKHAAGAKRVRVSAEQETGQLLVRVSDDGDGSRTRPPGGSGGYGLVGMRERVELLHGRLLAGPAPGGGWRVEAWLPLEGEG